ncbi:MAG: hypothetical protein R3C61_03060 [Bacteroidia bacterium]
MEALKTIALCFCMTALVVFAYAGPGAENTMVDNASVSVNPAHTVSQYHPVTTSSFAPAVQSGKFRASETMTSVHPSGTHKPGILLLIITVAAVLLFPVAIEMVAYNSIERSLSSRG